MYLSRCSHLLVFLFFLTCSFLDYEAEAADQVPLLMRMNKDDLALEKAIMIGDTDLGEL